jgi:hypothetical protein
LEGVVNSGLTVYCKIRIHCKEKFQTKTFLFYTTIFFCLILRTILKNDSQKKRTFNFEGTLVERYPFKFKLNKGRLLERYLFKFKVTLFER